MQQDGHLRCIVTFLGACLLALAPPAAGEADHAQRTRTVLPSDDLPRIVGSAKAGVTLLLADGIYSLTRPLVFTTPGVTMRSASGHKDKVILDGRKRGGKLERRNCVHTLVAIKASDVTIAHLTLRHARDHGIHLSPGHKGNIRHVVMRGIHVYDCGQQLIKANGNGGDPPYWTDDCILEDSLIEFRDTAIMQDMGTHFYTGGLDVHGGKGWIIRRNTFRNIQRDGKMLEHAIHMWSRSRDTLVEQNAFIDCYRGVGFGMKTKPKGFVRQYPDGRGETPYCDHIEGIVRHNIIFNRGGVHLESGIELMNVMDTKVYHNTVVSHDKPFSSIEYRWPNTRVEIMHNIVSHNIIARDGANAWRQHNIEDAPARLFRNYETGDLHLSGKVSQAVGANSAGVQARVLEALQAIPAK